VVASTSNVKKIDVYSDLNFGRCKESAASLYRGATLGQLRSYKDRRTIKDDSPCRTWKRKAVDRQLRLLFRFDSGYNLHNVCMKYEFCFPRVYIQAET
jgi:hypothetical protein